MRQYGFLVALITVLGVAQGTRAAIIADTVADFSTVAQGTNGFQYGYYPTDTTVGVFSTANMSVSGASWVGTGAFSTPIISSQFMHPGDTDNPQRTAVRQYTIGGAGEEAIDTSVPVTISGKFWDSQQTGDTIGFVTVDGVEKFAGGIPEGSTESAGFLAFNFSQPVSNNSKVEFGVRPNGNFNSDGSAMSATIDATPIPEPASLSLVGAALLAVRRRQR